MLDKETNNLSDDGANQLAPSLGGRAAYRPTHYEPSLSLDRLLPGLRDALGSDDRGQRLETIEQIIEGGSDRVVPLLIELLQDVDNAKSRQRIIAMLGQMGDARAVEPLATLLDDADAGLRKVAAWALGQIGSAEAVEPLLDLLEHENNSRVAGTAILSLGKIGDLRSLPILMKYAAYEAASRLDFDDALEEAPTGPLVHVAWTALKMLGQTCRLSQIIEMLHGDDQNIRQWAIDRFIHHIGMPAIEHLSQLKELVDTQEDTAVRKKAVHLLAALDSEEARDVVLQALTHPDEPIRLAAFQAVGDRQIQAACDILLSRYAEEERRNRQAIIEAIGVMDDPRVVPFLLDLVEKGENSWGVTQALRARGDVDVPHLLLERLRQTTSEAHVNILRELRYFNTSEVVAALLGIAHHSRNEEERLEAIESIRLEQYPEVVSSIIDIVRHDSSISVRRAAIWELVSVFDAQIEALLRTYLAEDVNDALRVSALSALLNQEVSDGADLLLAQINLIKDEEALADIVYRFHVLGDDIAFPLMARLYRTARTENLRAAIIDELEHYHADSAVPLVLDALKNDSSPQVRSYAVGTLYYASSDPLIVRDALIEALHDTGCYDNREGQRICDIAADYLRDIGSPEALAALEAWQQAQVPGSEDVET
ncbi:MAG: HEAT repeat domain-containing protein [Anaerolineae bacterium]|nr:HEAT repeat domain-containing protein [Anaerolineae bacterium]